MRRRRRMRSVSVAKSRSSPLLLVILLPADSPTNWVLLFSSSTPTLLLLPLPQPNLRIAIQRLTLWRKNIDYLLLSSFWTNWVLFIFHLSFSLPLPKKPCFWVISKSMHCKLPCGSSGCLNHLKSQGFIPHEEEGWGWAWGRVTIQTPSFWARE